ncbi:MAG: large subunit ribosomal protein L17 [Parcubacteria group bacterium Gr01-1014_30]|nr:MAG: large subunit ribosomal protein L17 [Parcubacteria group bacterium Gr01-1014_30]
MKSLAQALTLREKIKTTEAKAKELAPFFAKQVTRAKAGSLAAKRSLSAIFSQAVVKKLVDEVAPRHKDRKGGYTRIIKLGQRKSDGARLVIIELVK